MAIDLNPLLQKAFYVEQVQNATEAIERAREEFVAATKTGGRSLEVVVPPEPDEAWAQERLLHPLVYYCESEGTPLPRCPGVFLSLFVGDRLHCVAAADILAWAEQRFGLSADEMRERYGTHERETAYR